jgi:hypothetical protein
VSAPPQPLVYPAASARRRLDVAVLTAAAVVLYLTFVLAGVATIVGGIVFRSVPAALFGVLWTVILVVIARINFVSTASRLEFADGVLTWRAAMPRREPRSGQLRSIRYAARDTYVSFDTADGRRARVYPRRELKQFIDNVQAASSTVRVDLQARGFRGRWMNGKPPGAIEARIRWLAQYRGVRYSFAIVVACVILGTAAELSLTLVGAQENFKTLHSDLARVHLEQRGYRMTSQQQAGHNCAHRGCTLTQTWVWSGPSSRPAAVICRDVDQAMKSAYGQVDPNSPIPADAACDYYSILGSILYPGQGKRNVELIVQPDTSGAPVIDGTASY